MCGLDFKMAQKAREFCLNMQRVGFCRKHKYFSLIDLLFFLQYFAAGLYENDSLPAYMTIYCILCCQIFFVYLADNILQELATLVAFSLGPCAGPCDVAVKNRRGPNWTYLFQIGWTWQHPTPYTCLLCTIVQTNRNKKKSVGDLTEIHIN
jgi:hypothetical protein